MTVAVMQCLLSCEAWLQAPCRVILSQYENFHVSARRTMHSLPVSTCAMPPLRTRLIKPERKKEEKDLEKEQPFNEPQSMPTWPRCEPTETALSGDSAIPNRSGRARRHMEGDTVEKVAATDYTLTLPWSEEHRTRCTSVAARSPKHQCMTRRYSASAKHTVRAKLSGLGFV